MYCKMQNGCVVLYCTGLYQFDQTLADRTEIAINNRIDACAFIEYLS